MRLISFATSSALPKQSGKRGSNPRPSAWEANALPTELLPLNPAFLANTIGLPAGTLPKRKLI